MTFSKKKFASLKKALFKSSSKADVQHPDEFLCPISMSPMADPVIVSSGQSYERRYIEAWLALGRTYCYVTGAELNPPSIIPNVALRNAISNWCSRAGIETPKVPDEQSATSIVQDIIAKDDAIYREGFVSHSVEHSDNIGSTCSSTDHGKLLHGYSETGSSNDDSFQDQSIGIAGPTDSFGNFTEPLHEFSNLSLDASIRSAHSDTSMTLSNSNSSGLQTSSEELNLPNPFATKPCSYSSQSCEIIAEEEAPYSDSCEGTVARFVHSLKHAQTFEQEQAVSDLRKLTRNSVEGRTYLCTKELLASLLPLLVSRYSGIQINAVATLVNLSLENDNKLKVVRAGAVPYLIDVLKMGHSEAQLHAAGALFSLALNDDNKTAIGVLGAIPPLLHLLRSGEENTRQDAAMALYHLSFSQSNRTKLIKYGAVSVLLNLAQEGDIGLAGRCLIILHNIAFSPEGRKALLDVNGITLLINILAKHHDDMSNSSHMIQENIVAVLLSLSRKNLRFKSLAMQAGATEYLVHLVERGSPRTKEKSRLLLNILREAADDENEEPMLVRSHRKTLGWSNASGAWSSEF